MKVADKKVLRHRSFLLTTGPGRVDRQLAQITDEAEEAEAHHSEHFG